jgi:predicted RNase H-like nuclease (RuvC/YqgF family)
MKAEIITAIIGAAVAFITYLLGKKKSVAEVAKIEAEAHMIEVETEAKQSEQWQLLYDEMRRKVDELSVEVEKFREENGLLRIEVLELRRENKELKGHISRLEKRLNNEHK